MSESLTPEAILTDVSRGKINKHLAADLLLSLIEKNSNPELRTASIFALQKLVIPIERVEIVYKTIESCLLSDEDPFVRNSAATLIAKQLLKYGIDALSWTIQHDSSPLVIKTLIDIFLDNQHISRELTECLQVWVKEYADKIGIVPEEAPFFLEVEYLFTKNIKSYEISDNSFSYFRFIRNMKSPKSFIYINNRHVERLYFNFYNWLYLKRNQDIINSFNRMKDLTSYLSLYKKYDLKFKDSNTLPSSIGSLSRLIILDLSENGIKNIPNYIFTLSNLRELNLSRNEITQIPTSILKLKNLKVLNLKNNNLKIIPPKLNNYLTSLDKFQY